jgi:gliding motility-associated-like protein
MLKTNVSGEARVIFIFGVKDSGRYCIWLAIDNNGCIDTAKQCLFVNEACTLPKQIPNVFSPNGDGINDIFTIKSTGLRELICTLYNRWGMEIYQYDAVKTGWDGHTFSDNKAPDGTYYYILKATCLTSSDQLKGNGFLQLVR